MPLIDGGVGVSPSNRTIGTGIHIAGLEKGVLWADGREMYQD